MNARNERAIGQFIDTISNSHRVEVSPENALRFLAARKYDVNRAVDLYKAHDVMRKESRIDCFDNPSLVFSELTSGKFTVLGTTDQDGAGICVFSGRLHDPLHTDHQSILQAALLQLDCLTSIQTVQDNGLIFVYDMTGSRYSNFDYKLSQKLLYVLKGAYPARLKLVFVVAPPMWFRAPYKIMRLVVREKLRERVFLLSMDDLVKYIPISSLPKFLGGSSVHEHGKWVNQVMKQAPANFTSLLRVAQPPDHSTEIVNGRLDRNLSVDRNVPHETVGSSQDVSPSEIIVGEQFADVREEGVSIYDVIDMLQNEENEITKSYFAIRQEKPVGPYSHFQKEPSKIKNRYTDVFCYDHSRVALQNTTDGSDYIHANFVDGFRQTKEFICAQGPKPNTIEDFWVMVWEQNCSGIVMLTRLVEKGVVKCSQYWPEPGVTEPLPGIHMTLEASEPRQFPEGSENKLIIVTVKDIKTGREKTVSLFQYLSWPDHDVPEETDDFLRFLLAIREEKVAINNDGAVAPIVIHCSAGIGRTGTFVALDICSQQLIEYGVVDVFETVRRIRSQRGLAVNTPAQFRFIHISLVKYAMDMGLLEDLQEEES